VLSGPSSCDRTKARGVVDEPTTTFKAFRYQRGIVLDLKLGAGMKRRDFIAAVGAVVAWPFVARARLQERSQNTGGLEEARRRFDKISQPSEAARSDYVTRLVRMREEMVRRNGDEWKAIDHEVREHPAPKDSDGKVLSRRLVGKWSSPRHDYPYRSDGSWTMLPADEGTTHGTWRIEDNQFFTTASIGLPDPAQYTIILITKKDFVIADQSGVFYETRLI
jgi:hypothetical protein